MSALGDYIMFPVNLRLSIVRVVLQWGLSHRFYLRSKKSCKRKLVVERLPGAHCYEFYMGSDQFAEVYEQELGTFYLTDYLVRQFDTLIMGGLGIDKHPELLSMYFGNYKRLLYMAQTEDASLQEQAKAAAEKLGLEYEYRFTGLNGMGQFMGIDFDELSIYQPTSGPLMVRVLEVPEFKERYTKIVRQLIQGPCSAQRMTAAYHAAKKTVASAIAEEATRSKIVTGGSGGSGKGKLYGKKARPVDLELFFVAREKSVLDQLAGRSQGVTLEGGKKGSGKGKGTGKKFDAKAYLAGAKKKFKAMVEAGQMTAEEAEARIAELKKKLKGSSKGSNKKRRGKGKKL